MKNTQKRNKSVKNKERHSTKKKKPNNKHK